MIVIFSRAIQCKQRIFKTTIANQVVCTKKALFLSKKTNYKMLCRQCLMPFQSQRTRRSSKLSLFEFGIVKCKCLNAYFTAQPWLVLKDDLDGVIIATITLYLMHLHYKKSFLWKPNLPVSVNALFHFANTSKKEKLYQKLKKPIWINMKFTTQTFSFFRNQNPYPQEPYPPAHWYNDPLSPDWLLQVAE